MNVAQTILYSLIGWPCFAGLVIMILAGPVQGIVMKKLFALNRSIVKTTDARVNSTNEALQGIQSVKMQTWEDSFLATISKQRAEELKSLKSSAYLRGFSRAYMGALPGIVAVTSFIVYALGFPGADISASTLFAALVAFDQLRFPLLFYPMALAQLVQARVSATRVEAFLDLNEIGISGSTGEGVYIREHSEDGSLSVRNADIYWSNPRAPKKVVGEVSDDDSSVASTSGGKLASDTSDLESASDVLAKVIISKPILKNLNMDVKRGELCAVVGRVASGKSTLCAAILNEAFLEKGEIELKGRVAYAAQSPWILNATLRDNILFGLPYDEIKFQRVIKACQLEHDLDILTNGQWTEIGEKGQFLQADKIISSVPFNVLKTLTDLFLALMFLI
jgi:ATP-binding cassette subfamily C (CFTR/MRP) protein 1